MQIFQATETCFTHHYTGITFFYPSLHYMHTATSNFFVCL